MPIAADILDRTLHTPLGEQGYNAVEMLVDAGFEAWWVGGSVRDMLLGGVPDDIDIATNAKPDDIKKLFPKHDDHAEALGSIVVSLKGQTFEVTTFRKDHDLSNGRHPESVEFASRDEDAARRDITMNAMYYHPITGELFDPFEGEKDLNEKLIRIIGEPVTRIEHDALRLLRVIRFRALVNGQYHPETFQALHRTSALITGLSGDRQFQELEKMLKGPHPEIAFEDLWETDVIEHLMPELHRCKGVAQPADYHKEGDVWNHTLQCISSFTDDHGIDVRLAALFHDIGKAETFSIEERIRFDEHATASADITKIVLERLKLSKKRIQKICWLVEHHMMMGSFEKMNDKRKSHWYYHPWFIELLQLFWLDVAGTTPSHFDFYEEIVQDYNQYLDSHPKPPKPLLSGDDVMDVLGIEPGSRVGEILKELYDLQLEKKITTKKEALNFIEGLTK